MGKLRLRTYGEYRAQAAKDLEDYFRKYDAYLTLGESIDEPDYYLHFDSHEDLEPIGFSFDDIGQIMFLHRGKFYSGEEI